MVRQVSASYSQKRRPSSIVRCSADNRYISESTELKAAKLVIGCMLSKKQAKVIQDGELVNARKLDDIRADSTHLTISKKISGQEKTFEIDLTAINSQTAHFKIREPRSSWSADSSISLQRPETGKLLPEIADYIHKLLPKLAENRARALNAALLK